MSARHRLSAFAKTKIRHALWRVGYDIVPLASGFGDVQRACLLASDLLIDVGANVGQFAERARSAGYDGPIVSYEPSAATHAILARHAASDDKWRTRQAAAGSESGNLTLNLSANTTSSSLLPIESRHVGAAPKSAVVDVETVSVVRLDQDLASTAFADAFLKLDVQGFEGEALDGAEGILKQISAVQCELSVVPLYAGQADYVTIINRLRDVGFSLVHIEPEFQDPDTGAVLQLDALFSRS